MNTITEKELKAVLDSHELWLEYGNGERAVLDGTDLSGMAGLLQGRSLCRASLRHTDMHRLDLSGTDLAMADMTGAVLTRASLDSVDMTSAILDGATLDCANLAIAVLDWASLKGASLRQALLIGTSLTGADLTGADLTGADLGLADLDLANLTDAVLDNVLLHGIHLESRGGKVKGAPIYQELAPEDSYYSWSLTVLAAGPQKDWRWFLRGTGAVLDMAGIRLAAERLYDDNGVVDAIVEAADGLADCATININTTDNNG